MTKGGSGSAAGHSPRLACDVLPFRTMSIVLRSAGVVLLVLVAALVLLPCGAPDGEACPHACCERPRPVVGIRAAIARLVAALAPLRAPAAVSLRPLYGASPRAVFAAARPEVAPLRL